MALALWIKRVKQAFCPKAAEHGDLGVAHSFRLPFPLGSLGGNMQHTRIGRASAKCAIAALLAVAIFALSTPTVFAAGGVYGSLSGTVLDASTRAPISGASITAKSPSSTYSATTDSSGHFTILGVASDTYTVTVTASGHDLVNVPGVTVFGDQQNSVGTVALEPHLATIARVTSRSVSNAYQPTQTTDQYTINATQIVQATGKAYSTNENQALLSVPGVTLTNNKGMTGGGTTQVTIRGGAAYEVGYQFDGVPFREPFLNENASFGLMNGVGNVQVVEGAGDATQAGVGAGVINVIPQRGSGPGSGTLDLEVGGPNYNHQLGVTYGFSTPDNRISEYVSFIGQRLAPYYGYASTNLAEYGNYFANTYTKNDQILNNFFYKFGNDLNQQLQVLYQNVDNEGYSGALGCGGVYNAVTNPCANVYYPYDTTSWGALLSPVAGLFGITPSQYSGLVPLAPGTPATNIAPTGPQQNFSNQTRFLKIEYDNNLTPTTYLALRYYNWETLEYTDASYSVGPWLGGGTPGTPQINNVIGGPTSGVNLDILHQFGSNLTVTLNGQYNVLTPVWNDFDPGYTGLSLLACCSGLAGAPTQAAWLPGGPVYTYFATNAIAVPAQDCSTYPTPAPFASNCLPRFPDWGINYNGTKFQEWGGGIRFQYNPSDRLRFDLGFREEGQDQHWVGMNNGQFASSTGFACNGLTGPNQVSFNCLSNGLPEGMGPAVTINNPYDVSNASWTNAVLYPTVAEPRASVSYEMGTNNSLRFSYGRSAVFADAQTAGTPFGMYGLEPYLNMPATAGSMCGWAATTVFPCKTFAQQLYWEGDNLEAPDAGNGYPAVYTNYDLSYNHLFPSGYGMRITGFNKIGSNLPTFFLLNPVLGIFAVSNQGYNKTTGAEFDFTTPQRPVGLSGFFAATYQNVLSTTPPFTTAENEVPLVNSASLALGDLYRAGYVSPFSIDIGAIQNFKNGFTVSPQLHLDIGYPYTNGNLIAGQLSNGTYVNVPQVDFGPGITSGNSSLIGGAPGAAISTNYYDPSNPGSALAPNIAATRGISATAANGGYLSHFNLTGNLTFQYKFNRNTIGVQLLNVFGNAYIGSVPAVNPYYQPVATGVSGPQTNVNACTNEIGAGIRGCYATIPYDTYAFTNGAYLLTNGNYTGTPVIGPTQPFAIQVYYQRSF